jgi:hypothetical protein
MLEWKTLLIFKNFFSCKSLQLFTKNLNFSHLFSNEEPIFMRKDGKVTKLENLDILQFVRMNLVLNAINLK